MKIIIVYDNNVPKSEVISDVIGNKGFADIVIKKQRVEEYAYKLITSVLKNAEWKRINSDIEYTQILNYIKQFYDDDVKILHLYSNYFIKDNEQVSLSFQKLFYIDEPYKVLFDKKISGLMFSNARQYIQYCKNIIAGQSVRESAEFIKNSFDIDDFIDISQIDNFIKCITGNFESRYFNSFKENEFTITKTSTDKLKIKKEYTYYQLLPEDMKLWFVMPFNYTENEINAGYTMERLHMTDLAIKWVHGSIDENEFNLILNKYFYFFKSRHSKICSDEEYKKIADKLYIEKVETRFNNLKKCPQYEQIKRFLSAGNLTIEELVSKYLMLKEKIEKSNKYPKIQVIGHGDPGFANALYNKSTQMLKFIDPKGALNEDELWTNPYYDVAKLSHCINGLYDFFNNGLFEIKLNEHFKYDLEIPFNNEKYKNSFKEKLIQNGFDYYTVRIYETSLFLSMLPLHIDNPFKVFGFILNAKKIIEELEKNV